MKIEAKGAGRRLAERIRRALGFAGKGTEIDIPAPDYTCGGPIGDLPGSAPDLSFGSDDTKLTTEERAKKYLWGLDPDATVTIQMSRLDAMRARMHLSDIAGPMPTDEHHLGRAIFALQFSAIHEHPCAPSKDLRWDPGRWVAKPDPETPCPEQGCNRLTGHAGSHRNEWDEWADCKGGEGS